MYGQMDGQVDSYIYLPKLTVFAGGINIPNFPINKKASIYYCLIRTCSNPESLYLKHNKW